MFLRVEGIRWSEEKGFVATSVTSCILFIQLQGTIAGFLRRGDVSICVVSEISEEEFRQFHEKKGQEDGSNQRGA